MDPYYLVSYVYWLYYWILISLIMLSLLLFKHDIKNQLFLVKNITTVVPVVECWTLINIRIYLGQCCLFHCSTKSLFCCISYAKLTFARYWHYCTKEKTVNLYMIMCTQSPTKFTTDFSQIFYHLETKFFLT